jgi:hypothetical protein
MALFTVDIALSCLRCKYCSGYSSPLWKAKGLPWTRGIQLVSAGNDVEGITELTPGLPISVAASDLRRMALSWT